MSTEGKGIPGYDATRLCPPTIASSRPDASRPGPAQFCLFLSAHLGGSGIRSYWSGVCSILATSLEALFHYRNMLVRVRIIKHIPRALIAEPIVLIAMVLVACNRSCSAAALAHI